MSDARRLRVGIIGMGRSGRDIHAAQLTTMSDHYVIAAVADGLQERRRRAVREYDCRAYQTYEEMVETEQFDLIVNASPSDLHFPITFDLLNGGFNVLCEKPLAKSTVEVDRLIEASEKSGKLLAVFQQNRYLPAFVKICEIINSGVLGRIVQVDFTNSGFTRRWDWQTLQSNNGGSLLNTGPHPVDQALHLFSADVPPHVFCAMDRTNTLGDAEDYVKLILRGAGQPTIDIEISSCSAYSRPQFVIQGTNGGLHGNSQLLEWKYFKPEEAPKQELVREPLIGKDGNPAYCQEVLTWHEHCWEMSLPEGKSSLNHMAGQLYLMLHRTLTAGEPLDITPQQVRRQMVVMEECRRQNPQIYGDH
jgi:scyllo-inositol 2-dehydrogenase (NADP+)